MGKKGKIAAIIAAIGAAVAGIFFSKKKNRDKARKKFEQAKSRTISATNKAKQRVEKEFSLSDVKGLGEVRVKRLRKNGIVSLAQLRRASLSRIAQAAGVSEDQARKIQNSAKGMK